MKFTFTILPALLFANVSLATSSCPTPPTAIDLFVESRYEYDKKTQDYTYTYQLRNSFRAKTSVFLFQIESAQNVTAVKLPQKWALRFDGASSPSTVIFSSGQDEIKPSESGYIFKVKSKLGPGITRYYAEGDADVRKAFTANGDEESIPPCPGFYDDVNSVLDSRVTGYTIGPVVSNQVDAKLKMKVKKDNPPRGWDDECDEPEISSVESGKIELVLYGAKDLDLSKVELSSLRFGPANVAPLSAKLVERSHLKHWKKAPEDKYKMILMEFNIADLQIRCDIDNALFLKAKAGDKSVMAGIGMKPSICDDDIWKRMGVARHWKWWVRHSRQGR